ncbi:class I SAM-dependent methyltransferase [Chitinophaga rhizophila]|uniref:Class I SAM-dependent methyltransferase n=1 Tax=Chitinophaga rhizophila TaxID=2866212 RepID=A0ABS7G5P7_9BACT|nr:class I SAM-dependent methyltransferase [Chitinophaga rhizophila]MBW8682726.1 class I SAM-dependent methyltransferase [Chitinophaga rhizophila]
MTNNYDNIARYYDVLSRVVFGSSQRDAQVALLSYIPADSRILIAGGGTGWILEKIAAHAAPGLHIWYVEISAKMLEQAKKKHYQPNNVTFIHQAIEDFRPAEAGVSQFDVIITPFLFDNFSAARITPVFMQLHHMLAPGGRWLFTDFHYQQHTPFWQQVLLNTMYTFFRIICKVEAGALENVAPLFQSNGYSLTTECFYFGKFIRSAVYSKSLSAGILHTRH